MIMFTVFCPIVVRTDVRVDVVVLVGSDAVLDVLELIETGGIFSYVYTNIHAYIRSHTHTCIHIPYIHTNMQYVTSYLIIIFVFHVFIRM